MGLPLVLAAPLNAEDAPAERRNFVACPIVRDTASVPCWLAEHEGELYFLTLQTDVSAPVTPPWLGHRVLVEGTVAAERPRICGGIVLEPVVLSVLPELDASCNTAVLPAEERYNLTFEPPRPPGPSAGRLAFAGHRTAAARRTAARASRCATTSTASSSSATPPTSRRSSTQPAHATRTASRSPATAPPCSYRTARRSPNSRPCARRRAEQVAALLRGAGLTDVDYEVYLARRARSPERPKRRHPAPRHSRAHALTPLSPGIRRGSRGARGMDAAASLQGRIHGVPAGPFGVPQDPQKKSFRGSG